MSNLTRQWVALGAMVFAIGAAVVIGGAPARSGSGNDGGAPAWLADIESGADHIGAAELADEIMAARGDLLLVDVRPADEYAAFHLPTAINLTVPQVVGAEGRALLAARPRLCVLYSNGPAHPGQAWVELRRQGHDNVRVLAGGLDEFAPRMLTPPSLADVVDEAQSKSMMAAFRLRRAFFLGRGAASTASWATDPAALTKPTVVSPAWLQRQLGGIAVIDVRPRGDFAAMHVPGAVHLDLAALRQKHGDRDLLLRSPPELAEHFGRLGIARTTPVAIVTEDKLQDATLAAMTLLAAGHSALAIVEGGILRWASEQRPLTAAIATPTPVKYELPAEPAAIAIGIDELAAAVKAEATKVLDVRPPEFYRGDKSTEARPGHIPGAVNRPFQKDYTVADDGVFWRSREQLVAEFAELGLKPDSPVAVSCRTGHTASESFFVLRYLLGYEKARWFNGSWTEWAERSDLPAATGGGK